MAVIRRWTVAVLISIVGMAAAVCGAQMSSGSALVVRVEPEAHLNISAATLTFQVTAPGETVSSPAISVTAWVRALPGQQIRLSAQSVSLSGPAGAVPASALTWNGLMENATAGAKAASCTSGTFETAAPSQLISDWNQSGIATCAITFQLHTDSAWAPGVYTGATAFALLAQ